MSLLRPADAPVHVPARARDVYDVTGAGDTVIGMLATALAAKKGLVQAWSLPISPPASSSPSWARPV